MPNNKQFAFTLAEVLITLGIIGVVAALTIPILMSNSDKQKTVSQVKEIYSILGQANGQINNDCGGDLTGCLANPNAADGNSTTRTDIANLYKAKLSITKDCPDSTITGCFGPTYVALNNGGWATNFETGGNYVRFILKNGISIAIDYRGPTHNPSYFDIYMDTNGPKGPNQFGKDFFGFYYDLSHKRIIPYPNNDCSAGSTGYGCADRVIQEGAINYY